jgi:hypothetical protein
MTPARRTQMTRRTAAVLAALALGLGLAGCGGGDDDGGATTASGEGTAAFLLDPLATGGPHGAASLTQDGTHVTGWIVVWGLEPGSVHPNHLHANPEGEAEASCPDAPTDRHAVDFEPLRADASGVAFRRVDIEVGEPVVRPGVYWMVHKSAAEAAESPGAPQDLACGDIVAGEGG